LLGAHRDGADNSGAGVEDENGNVGFTFIKGGALNGGGGGADELPSNGIIPLLIVAAVDEDDEHE
jgi:hypothetical protein